MNNLEIAGEWLVGDAGTWETGILRFSQEQGARLELPHTKPKNYSFPVFYSVILGRTGIGDVTLINCRNSNSQIWFYNDFGFQVYSAQYVFVGLHYDNIQEIIFEKVQFNLNNLSDWINKWGLKHQTIPSENKFSFEYSVPDSLKFNVSEGITGNINFECSTNFNSDNERIVTIKESHQIELAYNKEKYFEKILEDITKFQNLLSIFIYELTFPLYINFFPLKTANQEQVIKLYYKHANYKINFPQSQNQIIFFNRLSNLFISVIPKWFDNYEKIQSALFLFLSILKEKNSFSSEKFLSIIKAIETFHINISEEKENENLKLKKKFDRIINDVKLSKDKKYVEDLLYERLRPTLKERLNDFITIHNNKYIQDKIQDIEDFKNKSSDSRNYYTHLDPKMKEKALKGKELYDLYIKLIGLYLSVLYSYLKIENNVFEERLKTALF